MAYSPTGMGPPDDTPAPGGAWMSGSNQLQQKIDALTAAVQNLTNKLSSGAASNPSTPATLNQVATGGNGAVGFSNPGFPSMAGNFNSPVGQVPTWGAPSTGNGGWGAAAGAFGGAVASSNLSGGLSAIGNYGGGQLGNQAVLSQYLQQGAVFGGNAAGMRAGITTLNDIASSANDLAQGNALINYTSGAYGTQNGLSRNLTSAANMAGFLNPALGWTGSAALAAQMYSPQTSLNMMMMGYGVTPRILGGGFNSSSAVLSSIMQRTFGGRSVSQKAFNASAAPNGRLNYNLQALGFSGQDLTNMESMLSAQNKLANAGYSNGQIQGIFAGAKTGNQNALGHLKSVFGSDFTNSIVQTLKNKTALSTQRTGETEQGFQTGLEQSVGLLNKFNAAINHMLNGPLGKFVGYTGGVGASGILGKASSILTGFESGGLMGGFSSIIGNVMGGGAAASPIGGGGSMSNKPTSKLTSGISGAAKAAVGWAETQKGVPYRWGGEQPGVGFDCSGLTQWAYGKAGVKIPRTSQQQWAALARGHSIPLSAVQEGDLVFTAGSDGTASAPGHVALAVSNKMLIQAEQTGTNIMMTPFDPRQWQHAARPTGPGMAGTGPSGGAGGGPGGAGSSASGGPASGLGSSMFGYGGYSEGGSMGSREESDAVNGSGGFMSGFLGNGGGFSGTSGTGTGVGTGKNGSNGKGGTAPAAGNVNSVQALAKAMAAKRGWTGALWNDLNAVEMREAGWRLTAKNPSSGAYGIAQFINGPSEYQQYGGNANTAQGQVTGFLNYVEQRYHGPAAAWAHEQAYNWYSRGTNNAAPGISIVGEDGPEAVVTRGGEKVMTAGQTAGLLAQIQSGGGSRSSAGGVSIILQLGNGAIQINGMGLGHGSDVSQSAREIASQLGTYLAQQQIVQKLKAGVSG